MSDSKHSALHLRAVYRSDAFKQAYPPPEQQLGVSCSDEGTVFRLWSPMALSVTLCLFADGDQGPVTASIPMSKSSQGIWQHQERGNLHGTYYLYRINHGDRIVETGDPWAIGCGCNSRRSMAVDLRKTDPEGWDRDLPPERPEEAFIYELHVKEFSWQESAGFPPEYRGKYKAFTCPDTFINHDGQHPTGLRYLRQLGITHVELMPVYDFGSIDERDPTAFNWGYDPVYWNVPEGSYATDAQDGAVRIREFKEMVQALHAGGFRVIMDVVYNHTYSQDSPFSRTVPEYFYRTDPEGALTNGSGCGNDFASEMPMAGKFILDSVLYWAKEYHIDGFRFDLMGLLDVELMNRIRQALDEQYGKGEKLMFGEPWAAGKTAMLPGHRQAVKENIGLLDANIGMFSDDIRDTVRGHVFDSDVRGFVTGRDRLEPDVLKSAVGWCFPGSPVKAPSQIISYVSSHDNHTLWDKLGHTFSQFGDRLRANKLAAAIYMTCQGTVFLLSGEEFGRTKNNHDNTFNESIELNRLNWKRAYEFTELREYYEGLIALRKQCPGLCDKSELAYRRVRQDTLSPGFAAYYLDNKPGKWPLLCILHNRNLEAEAFPLLDGSWQVLVNGESSFHWKQSPVLLSHRAQIAPCSTLILGLIPESAPQ